jgi:hypothetical protein
VNFHTLLQSTDFVLDKILIPEDEHEYEDEKNQLKSHAYALRVFLFSAFRIPHSNFRIPYTLYLFLLAGPRDPDLYYRQC